MKVSAPTMEEVLLLDAYTVVPAVAMKQSNAEVPQRLCERFSGTIEGARSQEKQWLSNALELLSSNFDSYKPMTWASHADLQLQEVILPAKSALLPLFIEKADTPAMIKHAMDILKMTTSFLNPGQIPVMACDCPIFAKAKLIQWTCWHCYIW